MTDLKIKINKHGYQRNGVGGESFHWFDITTKDDCGKNRNLIATLTVDDDEHPEKFNASCRVVSPDNLDDGWRGDVFEEAIRKQHESWYESWYK
jgi:hypothetical protein